MTEVPSTSVLSLPTVVLVKPREQGNIGAVARAMANMGLERLIVVEPAGAFGPTAQAFAVGARPLLEQAERVDSLRTAIAPFARVIGTTSIRDRSLGIPILTPRELPAFLAQDPPGTPVALVFGPEVGGLTNDDLSLASAVVSIPCAPAMPTLNLGQAVLIVVYELFLARGGETLVETMTEEPPASAGEIEGLLEHATEVMTAIGFDRDSSFEGVLRDVRRLLARAGPDGRDVRILRGLCRRMLGALGALRSAGK